jgi:hypothetical protein
MSNPDFLIVGETKCGTTSLFNYLRLHPQLVESIGNGEQYDESYNSKELRFFDRFYDRGIDWYRSLFPEKKEGQVTGEATPMYFYRVQVAQRVKKWYPDIKLILILRDPVDRFASQFYHNHKWVPGFAERYHTIEDFLNSSTDLDHYILQKGMYYYTLINWLNYFNREQFLILSSEEMFSKPESTYSKLCDFLELDTFKPASFEVFRSNEYPELRAETQALLIDYYRVSNEKLFDLIGEKFDWKSE